jgi:hypothetical protein
MSSGIKLCGLSAWHLSSHVPCELHLSRSPAYLSGCVYKRSVKLSQYLNLLPPSCLPCPLPSDTVHCTPTLDPCPSTRFCMIFHEAATELGPVLASSMSTCVSACPLLMLDEVLVAWSADTTPEFEVATSVGPILVSSMSSCVLACSLSTLGGMLACVTWSVDWPGSDVAISYGVYFHCAKQPKGTSDQR